MNCERAIELAINACKQLDKLISNAGFADGDGYLEAANILEYGETLFRIKKDMHVCKCIQCGNIYEWKNRYKKTFCPHCGAHFFKNYESVRADAKTMIKRRLVPRKKTHLTEYKEMESDEKRD